jgi:hypothetical protein
MQLSRERRKEGKRDDELGYYRSPGSIATWDAGIGNYQGRRSDRIRRGKENKRKKVGERRRNKASLRSAHHVHEKREKVVAAGWLVLSFFLSFFHQYPIPVPSFFFFFLRDDPQLFSQCRKYLKFDLKKLLPKSI